MPYSHGKSSIGTRSSTAIPVSERQQMALVLQMTSDTQGGGEPESGGVSSNSSVTTGNRSSVEHRNERGETPLHLAAIKGDLTTVISLLDRGADPNVADFAGWRPLHEACNHGWLGIAKVLIERGAQVNARGGLKDDTPLHDAAVNNHLQLVKLLIEHGGDATLKNKRGKSPADVAASPEINRILSGAESSSSNKAQQQPAGEPQPQQQQEQQQQQPEVERSPPEQKQEEDDKASSTAAAADQSSPPGGDLNSNQSNKSEMRRLPPQGKEKCSSSSATSGSPRVTLRIHQLKEKKEKIKSSTSTNTTNASETPDGYDNGVLIDTKNGGEEVKEVAEEESTDTSAGKDTSCNGNDDKGEAAEVPERAGDKRSAGETEEDETRRKRRKEDPEVAVESPKVPPLKIVLGGETETTRKSGTGSRLPYVVAAEEAPAPPVSEPEPISTTNTSTAPAALPTQPDQPPLEHDNHKRVLRSHRSGNSSSGQSGNSSPAGAGDVASPHSQVSPAPDVGVLAGADGASGGEEAKEPTISEKSPPAVSVTPPAPAPPTPPTDLHPRKRKLKVRQQAETSAASTGASSDGSGGDTPSTTQPQHQETPTANCYQLFLNIRKQIDQRRKGLFPVQPKPPQGFKDYLMNRCTYVLAGNKHNVRIPPPITTPPSSVLPDMKDMYLSQEKERYRLRTQHVIEKEKLVLSVEQEILRVHGRAARALANQSLPFSACTILKDEEVYSPFTAEQEEKERNARPRYNGRLFLSWLQDVDDKWEKIKEAMLLRHHNEAESLHAVQKMDWEWKLKEVASESAAVDEAHVPMVHVSDDFDLLPA